MKDNTVISKKVEEVLSSMGMYAIYSEEDRIFKIFRKFGTYQHENDTDGLVCTTQSLDSFMEKK